MSAENDKLRAFRQRLLEKGVSPEMIVAETIIDGGTIDRAKAASAAGLFDPSKEGAGARWAYIELLHAINHAYMWGRCSWSEVEGLFQTALAEVRKQYQRPPKGGVTDGEA